MCFSSFAMIVSSNQSCRFTSRSSARLRGACARRPEQVIEARNSAERREGRRIVDASVLPHSCDDVRQGSRLGLINFAHPHDSNILILSNVAIDGVPQGLANTGIYFHTDYS